MICRNYFLLFFFSLLYAISEIEVRLLSLLLESVLKWQRSEMIQRRVTRIIYSLVWETYEETSNNIQLTDLLKKVIRNLTIIRCNAWKTNHYTLRAQSTGVFKKTEIFLLKAISVLTTKGKLSKGLEEGEKFKLKTFVWLNII